MSDQEHFIEVPLTSLQPETLQRLVEEFVTRDTTDYGVRVRTLEEKVADVMRQLRLGEVIIVVEQVSNTINLVPAVDLVRS
jgi:uncharacterized protein YheU (UPF0270 family)